jgi:nitroreductase
MISIKKIGTAAEAMRSRVSVRRYTEEPVTAAEIREVVELAGHAPSAFNVQPWRFVAVTDADTKLRLQAAAMNQPQVGSAPVVLAVTSDMEDVMENLDAILHPGLPEEKREGTKAYLEGSFGSMSVEERAAFGRGQTNIALGYLLVALESLGYGSSPMLGFDPVAVREVLELPPHVEIVALVAFGRPAEEGFPKHRHPVEAILR